MSMEKDPWGTDWEINGEQSSDWESQVHQESVPTPSWSRTWSSTTTPSRAEQTASTAGPIKIEDVVEEEEFPSDDRQTYLVTFFSNEIRTTLTHAASVVDNWIANIRRRVHQEEQKLVVGLDIEWRPSFSRSVEHKVAILQLCVEDDCLIFQLLYADHIPTSLVDFLKNPSFTFVGVGIKGDVEKLLEDHEMNVLNTVDLRTLAATRLGTPELRNSGLKDLAKEVLGKEIGKPRKVTMSRWDAEWLTYDQVQYACLDAFLSFQIGKTLMLGNHSRGLTE